MERTITDSIVARAERDPDRLAIVLIGEDGSRQFITTGELHRAALGYATAFAAQGIFPGDLVVLVMRHSRELLSSFLGALYLGAIPSIFPYLTEKLDPAIYERRVRTLVAESGARAVTALPDLAEAMGGLLADVGCRVISTAEIERRGWADCGFRPVPADPDDIAVVQYTSGTTGLQKGIALSHRAILANLEARFADYPLRADDVVVSWLPLYHDMGLMSALVMPLVMGIPSVLMSPFYWLRKPASLLRAVHDYRGTLSWMPNFAFNHCVRSISDADLDGIDLSRWRSVKSGGEPIRHDTIHRFHSRFAPYGLRREALRTGYGLAENVLAVTRTSGENPSRVDWVDRRLVQSDGLAVPTTEPTALPIVSCGRPIPGTEVAIIGIEGERLPERRVGEITIRSNCMLTGYYRRPDLTAALIHDGWLATGDLGYLVDGELYVCGRKKDLIIVGGRNVYPQDLEAIADGMPAIQPGRAVAFGLTDEQLGTERVVLVCELRDDLSADDRRRTDRELRRQIVQQLDVTLGDVRLVPKGWVIKTPSGKVARSANREKYLGS